MATVRDIAAFDTVELTEAVEHVHVGARAGVLELRDGDVAMLEIMDSDLDGADRIVFVPLAKLRRVS
jgi:hypothetical protein